MAAIIIMVMITAAGAASDDFNKAIEKAGQKWASTDEGKAETKKLHDAEKELDKVKEAWKPFEKYAESK